jgi:hypothetical protein
LKLTPEQIDLVCYHIIDQLFDLVGERYRVVSETQRTIGGEVVFYDWHFQYPELESATLTHSARGIISLQTEHEITDDLLVQSGFLLGKSQSRFEYNKNSHEVLKELIDKNDTDAIISIF